MPVNLMQEFLYIHNAILKEAQDFEDSVRELNREDDAQIAGLLDRFKFYTGVLHEHHHGEEEIFFPVLEKIFRYISATDVYEHEHHSRLYNEIEELLTGLRQARGSSERADLARRLNRQAIALNALTDDHINEENELLLPAFEEHFSAEELGKLMDQALEEMGSPELLMQAVPWMLKAQTVDDLEWMLRSWMVMMPPDQLPRYPSDNVHRGISSGMAGDGAADTGAAVSCWIMGWTISCPRLFLQALQSDIALSEFRPRCTTPQDGIAFPRPSGVQELAGVQKALQVLVVRGADLGNPQHLRRLGGCLGAGDRIPWYPGPCSIDLRLPGTCPGGLPVLFISMDLDHGQLHQHVPTTSGTAQLHRG